MRPLRSRSLAHISGGWLATGAVIIGLLGGGIGYGLAQAGPTSLLESLTGRASAREVAAQPRGASPRTVSPQASLQPAAASQGQTTPPPGNSPRPTGVVTQITGDPGAFTIQAPSGVLTTYRVLDTTVFMAGHDRPYTFGLLKVGDMVMVRGGPLGLGQRLGQGPAATASPQPAGAAHGRATLRDARAGTEPANGEMFARQVIVRPAADANKRAAGAAGAGQAGNGTNGPQNGRSNAAGQ